VTGASGPTGPSGASGPTGATGATGAGGGPLATVKELELTTTGATAVLSYTPGTAGNFHLGVYFRVVTATTTVSATVTYTDVTGAQTITLLNAVAMVVGSYAFVDFMVDSAAGDAIAVNFTAGTANQVYVSASILQG
jgi:hypothetical protein